MRIVTSLDIKSSLSDVESVEDVGVAPSEMLGGGLEPRVLVYLLVDLAAVGLDVVVEPRHHGVPGADLGSGQVSRCASVLELEELHPFLVFFKAEIEIISSFLADFLFTLNEDICYDFVA